MWRAMKTLKDSVTGAINRAVIQNHRPISDFKDLSNRIYTKLEDFERNLFIKKFEIDLWFYAVMIFFKNPQNRAVLEEKLWKHYGRQCESSRFVNVAIKRCLRVKITAYERSLN